ncbi:MAG: hypothetical protein ACKVT1_19280 [Dehalococcoidia bacterium]
MARLESTLAYLESEWAAVPAWAAQWAEMSEFDRQDLWREWAIREDALNEIEQAREDGQLSADQCRRVERLLAVIATDRPAVERLFAA